MSQFKRFNSSDNTNWNTSDAYPTGTLTWDPDNGLRLHDSSTSGGNSVSMFSGSYNDLNDKPLTVGDGGQLTATGSITVPGGIKTDNGFSLTQGQRGQTNEIDTLLIAQNRFAIYTNNVQASTWDYKSWSFRENGDLIFPDATTQSTAFVVSNYISKTDLKTLVASSTDFADFQARIAAL